MLSHKIHLENVKYCLLVKIRQVFEIRMNLEKMQQYSQCGLVSILNSKKLKGLLLTN